MVKFLKLFSLAVLLPACSSGLIGFETHLGDTPEWVYEDNGRFNLDPAHFAAIVEVTDNVACPARVAGEPLVCPGTPTYERIQFQIVEPLFGDVTISQLVSSKEEGALLWSEMLARYGSGMPIRIILVGQIEAPGATRTSTGADASICGVPSEVAFARSTADMMVITSDGQHVFSEGVLRNAVRRFPDATSHDSSGRTLREVCEQHPDVRTLERARKEIRESMERVGARELSAISSRSDEQVQHQVATYCEGGPTEFVERGYFWCSRCTGQAASSAASSSSSSGGG